jgi:hypothetical protein
VKKSTVSLPVSASVLNVLFALGLALGASNVGQANEGGRDCAPSAWSEVKKLAEDCLALRESGEECGFIALENDAQSASFEIRGYEYRAEILESVYSDGGDLNDVLMDRDDGCKYELRNVPAFGDLLKALASVETR